MLRSNLASCITSSQSMECRETPCKPVPSVVVRCLKPTTDLETFDDLRLAAFNSNYLKMNFEKITCTSANARKHMGHVINNSHRYKPHLKMSLEMNAESYGFTFVKNKTENLIVPGIVTPSLKTLIPDPCTCGKCAHKNGYVAAGWLESSVANTASIKEVNPANTLSSRAYRERGHATVNHSRRIANYLLLLKINISVYL